MRIRNKIIFKISDRTISSNFLPGLFKSLKFLALSKSLTFLVPAKPLKFPGNHSKNKNRYHHFIFLCAAILLLGANQVAAELMLYPTRLVIEGNQRSAQVQLINNGTESTTYRISVVNRRMSELGAFSEIDTPLASEQFADSMLRYSPRQVTLAPGAGQTVRVMVRKPANLAEGEYRSHLLFSPQPKTEGVNSVENIGATDSGIDIKLTTLIGASIPVIVRQGKTSADVALTHLELQQPTSDSPSLAFHMERTGNQSVYGDLAVSFIPKGGTEQVIARANGVAVYTPNSLRRAQLILQRPDNLRLSNGTLRVTYREQAEDGGKLLAETTLPVQ